jgi:hypothetical protein
MSAMRFAPSQGKILSSRRRMILSPCPGAHAGECLANHSRAAHAWQPARRRRRSRSGAASTAAPTRFWHRSSCRPRASRLERRAPAACADTHRPNLTGNSGRKPKIGHLPAALAVTFVRNQRSQWAGIRTRNFHGCSLTQIAQPTRC